MFQGLTLNLAALRLLIRRLQVNPSVTDTHRIEMLIPVHDRIRTRAKPPETWPVASLQLLGPKRFLMDFRDSESHRRAKPKGVIGCEIWANVGGDPPTSPTDLRCIGTATRAPHRLELAVGRDSAWLRLAWLNRRGERGPFGPMVELYADLRNLHPSRHNHPRKRREDPHPSSPLLRRGHRPSPYHTIIDRERGMR